MLGRLPDDEFEKIIFGNDTLLNKPIEEWPICHCIIAFFSSGFPLEKAEAYIKLRQPFCMNDLSVEHILRDRRKVYSLLRKNNIRTPRYVVMNRDPGTAHGELDEHDDYVVVNGVRIDKPFVEKPVSGEDHNVYLYYPKSKGGGSKRLFRKVGNMSSKFYPDVSHVRREGSYIYEEFMRTMGTDVKVCFTALLQPAM